MVNQETPIRPSVHVGKKAVQLRVGGGQPYQGVMTWNIPRLGVFFF